MTLRSMFSLYKTNDAVADLNKEIALCNRKYKPIGFSALNNSNHSRRVSSFNSLTGIPGDVKTGVLLLP